MQKLVYVLCLMSSLAYGQANTSLSNLSSVGINTDLVFADGSGIPRYLKALGSDSLILKTTSDENGGGGILLDSANSVIINAGGNGNLLLQTNSSAVNINSAADFIVSTVYASVFYGQYLYVGTTEGLQLGSPGSPPTCDSVHAGTLFYQAGGTGVADELLVCMKDSSDNYAWISK